MIFWNYLVRTWERLLFAIVGLACLVFVFAFLTSGDIAGASAVFAMGFFSLFYSNLARFKRFKGLGFEAELWEDKQKEAEDLIGRLKSVVTIYSREVIMGQVMRGRLKKGPDWTRNWSLYGELVAQHGALGQTVDFSDLKRQLDDVFLSDMTLAQASVIRSAFRKAEQEARGAIAVQFGRVVNDIAGHSARHAQLNAITFDMKRLH